jgi:hypothetical protein
VVGFTPQLLYTQGRAPATHSIGGWIDPEPVRTQQCSGEQKSPCPTDNRTPVMQSIV